MCYPLYGGDRSQNRKGLERSEVGEKLTRSGE